MVSFVLLTLFLFVLFAISFLTLAVLIFSLISLMGNKQQQ